MAVQLIFKYHGKYSEIDQGTPFSEAFYEDLNVDVPIILSYFNPATTSQLRELCEILHAKHDDFNTHALHHEWFDFVALGNWCEQVGIDHAEYLEFTTLCVRHKDRFISLMLNPSF